MRFAEHRARMLATVDKTFAERVRLAFMAGKTPDPERAQIEISAKLRVQKGEANNERGGRQRFQVRVAAGKSTLAIDRNTYRGPDIREGDRVRAVERDGMPWFEVARVDDRDAGRLVLELNEA